MSTIRASDPDILPFRLDDLEVERVREMFSMAPDEASAGQTQKP
jgi:hypothetical protein